MVMCEYADDIAYAKKDDMSTLCNSTSEEIQTISDWYSTHEVIFNSTKKGNQNMSLLTKNNNTSL